ncbi:hypothetical protein M422DRAFT_250904, partial [Sphaerobolus stellatus SS14]
LLKDAAFGDDADDIHEDHEQIWTHRDLVNTVHETGLLQPSTAQKSSFPHQPKPSRADTISSILNLLRNFSLTGENQRFMGQHPELLGLILRVSSISSPPSKPGLVCPAPLSSALTAADIIKLRRDVLTIVTNIAPFTHLPNHPEVVRVRVFELLASFLVESHDLCCITGIVIQSGAISAATVRPPASVELALEAFSKLFQPDANRLSLSHTIKMSWLWKLFASLVHRLPISTEDFAIAMRIHDVWLCYLEKVVLCIYSLCFLATPELKLKMKTDRTLGFPKLVLRMVKRFVNIQDSSARQFFLVSSRRAIEALKLVDEGADPFESPQVSGPLYAFGMGFGETDSKQMETGNGVLAPFQDEVLLNVMTMSHLDEVMFSELDSLSRVSFQ